MGRKNKTAQAPVVEAEIPTDPGSPRPRLHKLRVSNFRCIDTVPVEIELDDIVVLVGPNNAGKSAILRAYEVAMQHGSGEGHLSVEDFPGGTIESDRLPTVELETVVYDANAPGARWVRTEPNGDMIVREKWTWTGPGAPRKVGWLVEKNDWHESEGPWGTPNVAQAHRPQPHRVDAFQHPAEQAEQVVKLLTAAITKRVKELSEARANGADQLTDYGRLMDSIKELRLAIASDAAMAVKDVEKSLGEAISEVFPDYTVTFDARPEEDIEKTLNLYKPNPILKMGLSHGFQTTLDRQGSGTCRTLIWAALRILAERPKTGSAVADSRPHLLLIDEPELCLHPDAIREACRVLYDLPHSGNWQVMVTTHSPVFIDLSRDNTSIVRVERTLTGIQGTTVFRPQRARLDNDDREELKLLNICDPYVAEFFFGGRTVIVEGDTEFTAFRYIASLDPKKYRDVHVVRARGKACIRSLCKILNQFNKGYGVLHDADRETVTIRKTGAQRANSMWAENESILAATADARATGRARVLACVPTFEEAFFGEAASGDKPYVAWTRVKSDSAALATITRLLDCLLDQMVVVPNGALEWSDLSELATAVRAFDSASAEACPAPADVGAVPAA